MFSPIACLIHSPYKFLEWAVKRVLLSYSLYIHKQKCFVSVFICICIVYSVCMYTYMYISMYIQLCSYMHVIMKSFINLNCLYECNSPAYLSQQRRIKWLYIYIYPFLNTFVCTCMYVHMCIPTYVSQSCNWPPGLRDYPVSSLPVLQIKAHCVFT